MKWIEEETFGGNLLYMAQCGILVLSVMKWGSDYATWVVSDRGFMNKLAGGKCDSVDDAKLAAENAAAALP